MKDIWNGRHGLKISSLENHNGTTKEKWKMTNSEKTATNNNNNIILMD